MSKQQILEQVTTAIGGCPEMLQRTLEVSYQAYLKGGALGKFSIVLGVIPIEIEVRFIHLANLEHLLVGFYAKHPHLKKSHGLWFPLPSCYCPTSQRYLASTAFDSPRMIGQCISTVAAVLWDLCDVATQQAAQLIAGLPIPR